MQVRMHGVHHRFIGTVMQARMHGTPSPPHRVQVDQEDPAVLVMHERGVDSGAGGVVQADVDLISGPVGGGV